MYWRTTDRSTKTCWTCIWTPVAPPRAEQNPLSGTEKIEGDNKDGLGTNIAQRLDNAQPVPEKIEGARDVKDFAGATSMAPAIDPRRVIGFRASQVMKARVDRALSR